MVWNQAVLIYEDGKTCDVVQTRGKFTLKSLQMMVGGYIEILNTKDGRKMVVNEEGKLNGSGPNLKATELWEHEGHDVIYGDVFVCDASFLNE